MSKRTYEDKIEYYNKKLLKLKSQKKRRRLIVYSSSDSEDNYDRNETKNDDTTSIAPCPSKKRTPTPRLTPRPESPVSEAQAVSPAPEPLLSPPLQPSPSPPSVSHPASPPPPTRDANNDEHAPTAVPIPELDPEFLQALGDASVEMPVYGPAIHDTLAQRWLPILKKSLHVDAKGQLLKTYLVPGNCKLLKAPILNPEISAAVADAARSRDKKIQERQDQLGLAITAVNRAMTLLLTGEDRVQAIKILSDSCRMLTDLHFTKTRMRTKLITPGLEKSFLTVIQDQDRDETLFGTTLQIKSEHLRPLKNKDFKLRSPLFQRHTERLTGALLLAAPAGKLVRPLSLPDLEQGGAGTTVSEPIPARATSAPCADSPASSGVAGGVQACPKSAVTQVDS